MSTPHSCAMLGKFLLLAAAGLCALPAQSPRRALGTVTSAAPPELTLKTDASEAVTVLLPSTVRVRKVAPGEKDLTRAQEITAGEIAVGDRVLVLGKSAGGGIAADSVVVMTAREIAQKREVEGRDWKERGTLGVVEEVDVAARTIRMVSSAGLGRAAAVTVDAGEKCMFRRYAPDSVRFADALPSSIEELRKGDQVRVLGNKDETGSRIAGEQIVFGSFRSVAGKVLGVNQDTGELTLKDAQSGKTLAVRLAKDTRLKRFESPGMMMGGGPGLGGPGRPDLSAMMERMPAVTPAELKTGDTVIVSSTVGAKAEQLTAIVLLANAEPLLSMLSAGANRGRNAESGPSIGSSLDRGLDGVMGGLMIQ